MKHIVVAVLAGLLFAGLGLAWFATRTEMRVEPSATGQPAPVDIAPLEATPEAAEAADAAPGDPPESLPPARLIRRGEASGQEPAKSALDLPESGNEEADRLVHRIEAGLDGDMGALIDVARLIDGCRRGMASEEQVQERLDRMAQFNANNPGGPVMPARGGGSVEFRSFEDLEADMWAQYDRCELARTVLNESLYEQVVRLAESGMPSARYLYSVWPPEPEAMGGTSTLELLEYQTLALEYTWMNLQERNPLGLLAMAQSYGARRNPLFTPTNIIQGQVFTLAATRCGVENEWLSRRTENFGRRSSRYQSGIVELPSLDEDASLLAERFCPRPADDE